jgi:S1-C subfamily serine protease
MFEDYVTKGIVSKINVFIPYLSITELFMIDAAVNPGNSGGPVFDTKGNVLGIAIARVPSMSGMGCVVPSADIAYVLEKARETLSKDKGTVNKRPLSAP